MVQIIMTIQSFQWFYGVDNLCLMLLSSSLPYGCLYNVEYQVIGAWCLSAWEMVKLSSALLLSYADDIYSWTTSGTMYFGWVKITRV